MKLNLRQNWTFFSSLLIATGIATNASSVKALNFNLNYDPEIDSRALAGFQEAASIWESVLSDDITVNLDIGFGSLDPGILGGAVPETVGATYSNFANALTADATSSNDAIAIANLPEIQSSGGFTFVGTEDDGTLEIVDGRDETTGSLTLGSDNTNLDVSRANAKALGLLSGTDAGTDASITFSSDFASDFDFDQSDGITTGKIDFIGVALHEMGHSLGFVSGVDVVDFVVDFNLNNDPAVTGRNDFDLDGFRVFSPLDMYRHSDLSVAVSDDAGFPLLDLSVEGKAGSDNVIYDGVSYDAEPYISIDGGNTSLFAEGNGLFSTGRNLGDGNQASHWKDDLGIGLLDPTIAPGELGMLTDEDVRAFDVMGYDLSASASVPFEFSPGLGLLLVGGAYTFRRLKKQKSGFKQ